jgi:hypothetical protein
MASSSAASVGQYLDELPPERRDVVAAVRDVVRRHLPAGYDETMNWGMICYEIPLARYPDTYNEQPLCYVALAAQKRHYALYLTNVAEGSEHQRALREAYAARGRRLDMGKSCLRFRRVDDLPLDVVGRIVASTTPDAYIAHYEASRAR